MRINFGDPTFLLLGISSISCLESFYSLTEVCTFFFFLHRLQGAYKSVYFPFVYRLIIPLVLAQAQALVLALVLTFVSYFSW